jgi:hypothetical protein
MFWQREEDKSRWSEIARDCLAVGTIVKIIWDWNLPVIISFPLLFSMMFASLFGVARDLIAILAFFLFIVFFIISYPKQGALLIIAFILYALVVKIFRRRYL